MNTGTHPVAPEEVMAFLDGELSDSDARVLSTHIESCAECTNLVEQIRSTSKTLSGWEVQAIPARLQASIADLALKTRKGIKTEKSNIFIRASFWTWKQWVAGIGVTVTALLILIAVATPNLMNAPNAAKRARELSPPGGRSVDSASINSGVSAVEEKGMASPTDSFSRNDSSGQLSGDSAKLRRLESYSKIQKSLPVNAQPTADTPAPMIARTVSLTLVVKNFSGSRATLDALLARHHSYAAQLSANTAENAPRSLQASLRVPATELASVLSELKSLGRVENETQSGEEVTQQHADLLARLKNSHETEKRMQAILEQRTGKISDVLEVEQEIARVRGEIEQMEAEQKTLEHRVEFATVNLNLTEDYKAQLLIPEMSVGTRMHNAFVAGYRNASETILGIVLFFVECGPTFVIWLVILGLPVVLVWRRYRRTLATV